MHEDGYEKGSQIELNHHRITPILCWVCPPFCSLSHDSIPMLKRGSQIKKQGLSYPLLYKQDRFFHCQNHRFRVLREPPETVMFSWAFLLVGC
ncbi:hypothetical protein Hanom_Chr17g01534111 [Helianthus anomalus]